MTIVRADGAVVQVRNPNPVAPRVVVVSPFAMMNQMAAQMDRRMNAQMAQARAAQNQRARSPQQNIAVGQAPQGAVSGVCMQSVEVTQVPGQPRTLCGVRREIAPRRARKLKRLRKPFRNNARPRSAQRQSRRAATSPPIRSKRR